MTLEIIDWAIIAAYFVLTLGVGVGLSSRASSSLSEYFLSGRSLPWWLAGTSMVATTFAADTPLAVTGFVAKHGLAGNWFWWAFALGGMFTVFVYARLGAAPKSLPMSSSLNSATEASRPPACAASGPSTSP
jgi:solute:Na+ symporter, SSS family